MKVLLISNTVISKTNNMGKTALTYFSSFSPNELAQFYIHTEIPTNDEVCWNYYRFTDKDALKSIVFKSHVGKKFSKEDIVVDRDTTRVGSSISNVAYKIGRKKTPITSLFRDIVWELSSWFSPDLKKWLDEFSPDVVFFMSGNFFYMYTLAIRIANYLGVPLVTSCVDDYYIENRFGKSVFARIIHKYSMRRVKKTIDQSKLVLTICDSMGDVYSKLFGCTCKTLHTGAKNRELNLNNESTKISYIGNVSLGRHKNLVEIGKALKELNILNFPKCIDVFSTEYREEIISTFTEDNGISFHGPVTPSEAIKIMENSMLVIHAESFDEVDMKMTRFSISTKIAESLMYGPCVFAYGPLGIASIDYLQSEGAAFVVSQQEELKDSLERIILDKELRDNILKNARNLANRNHNENMISNNVREWLTEVMC